MGHRTVRLLPAILCLCIAVPLHAVPMRAFVTAETGGANVIFKIAFDPAVAGGALPVVRVTEPRAGYRLDGIDFVTGSTTEVVVGAHTGVPGGAPPGGAITHYNVTGVGPAVLGDFVGDTNTAGGAATTRPSTILTTPSHYLYVENQFGFGGAGHRIMRTPTGAMPGVPSVVFDGAAAVAVLGVPLVKIEGLEIVGDRLFFFAEDHTAAGPLPPPPGGIPRALYSAALKPDGTFDAGAATPIAQELGGLVGGPDGADELDYDPLFGRVFGSNMLTGEIIFDDPFIIGGGGGKLIAASEIGGTGDASLDRLATAMLDGIRSTGDGFLVLTGLDGVIVSVDNAVAAAAGPALGAVRILFDGAGTYSFDDLTALTTVVPEPQTLLLLARRRNARA